MCLVSKAVDNARGRSAYFVLRIYCLSLANLQAFVLFILTPNEGVLRLIAVANGQCFTTGCAKSLKVAAKLFLTPLKET